MAEPLEETLSRFTPSGAGLDLPTGLAFDSAENLYVANAGDDSIYKFSPDGTPTLFASLQSRAFSGQL